ncbi:MAG: ribosome maturation factor RimM [Thermoanaerobaculia bacterium]
MSSRSSTTDPRSAPETVDVARIRRPHGVRGEVLVEVLSDVETRFRVGARLWIGGAEGGRRPLTVRSARTHTRGLILSFEELRDRDEAQVLSGAFLEVPRQEVPPAPADHWYPFELVGCRCLDGGSGDLGRVVDVVEDGGGLLLRVSNGEREVLVPFVRTLVTRVDTDESRIELELPEGFLEACASPS